MADDGNGKGAFWKVVGTVAILLLTWMGVQLQAVPAHEVRLNDHERRIAEQERLHAQEQAATRELIGLLRAEQDARARRGRSAR